MFGPGVDASYTYWNIGAALTYKVFTLDFRYHGTDMSRTECTTFLFVGPNNRCEQVVRRHLHRLAQVRHDAGGAQVSEANISA